LLLATCVDQLNGQESEQIWNWDGSVWGLVDDRGPEPLVVTGVTLDTNLQRLFRYGGLPLDSNECVRETWEWSAEAGWRESEILDSPGPSACDHVKMAYDSARQVSVLFGGGELQDLTTETSEWNGSAWRQAANDGPAPRAHHELFYDAATGRVTLFGGFDGTQVFGDLWTWDGDEWTETEAVDAAPAARSHAAMAAGPDSALLFGGATGVSTFSSLTAETWLLADGTWTELDVDAPTPRGSPALGFDAGRNVWVLYGGFSADGGELDDTWEFDGQAWRCADGCDPTSGI
jgi:hypothetical protein